MMEKSFLWEEKRMSDYLITTDNMTDLPDSYFQEHGLGVMSLTYMIDGKTYSKKNGI